VFQYIDVTQFQWNFNYEWVETESYLKINDIRLNETVVSLTINPSTDAKYGFWRNESRIFICTDDWLFMQDTAFNYSCSVTNPNPPYYTNHNFVGMNDVTSIPLISSCKSLVKLPAHIIGEGIDFCKSLIAIHNNESNPYGVKSDGPGFMVKVEEDTIQFLWLSEGSYRFFKHIAKIACKDVGNGPYSDCDEGELFPLEVREIGYDYSAEIVAVQSTREPWSGDSTSVTFGDIFSDKTKTTLLIVGLIAIVIITIIVIIILCCCCYYCPTKRGAVVTV
jgi:hypothetical protein